MALTRTIVRFISYFFSFKQESPRAIYCDAADKLFFLYMWA